MMTSILSIILCLVFLLLSGIHIYWLLGGMWGLKNAIPTKDNRPSSFQAPPTIATIIVALGLFGISLLYLLKSEIIQVELPFIVEQYFYWLIPSLFILRAIGDFNYVGLWKKINNTTFAKSDTQLFTPLCIAIGVLGFLISIFG